MAQSKRKKRGSVGILFWIAFVLLVAVIFLYNKQNIENVLETTGLVDVLSDRVGISSEEEEPEVTRPEQSEDTDSEGTGESEPGGQDGIPQQQPNNQEPELELDPVPPVTDGEDDEAEGESQDQGQDQNRDQDEGRSQGRDEQDGEREEDTAEGSEGAGSAEDTEVKQRRLTTSIYYIRVTEDGTIYPEEVERTVSYVDRPMTETLKELLRGPTREELNVGLLNLIPQDTRLLSATVEDGVAYLNFNESFRFNTMGVEGFVAQLQQIIYSTTEFSTVDQVQILIEGQQVDYLGGEGIYIGEPIGRNTFG